MAAAGTCAPASPKGLTVLKSFSNGMAASTWNDWYVRGSLGATGTVPYSGSLCSSPDIIPNKGSVEADPQSKWGSGDSYAQDADQQVLNNAPNYIYVRAKNMGAGGKTAKISLYAAPNNLINWPNLWTELKTSDGAIEVEVTGEHDAIVVAKDPFYWVAPSPPSGASHFCLIMRVSTDLHKNPRPEGSIDAGTWHTLVADNGFYAQQNVVEVDSGVLWTKNVDYDNGPDDLVVQMLVSVDHAPIGAGIVFSSGTPGPDPPMMFEGTVDKAVGWLQGVRTKIPGGYKSSVAISYKPNGKPTVAGTVVNLMPLVVISGATALKDREELHDFYRHTSDWDDDQREYIVGALMDAVGPIPARLVGGMQYRQPKE